MNDINKALTEALRASMQAEATMSALYDMAPERSEGSDETGCIKVIVARDGSLQAISVSRDWQRHIYPQHLGEHLTAAVSAAYAEQMSAVSRKRSSWAAPVVTEADARARMEEQAAELTAGTAFGSTMAAEDVAESALAFFRSKQSEAKTGEKDRNKDPDTPVVVRKFSGRISAIEVQAKWAQGRSGSSVATAVKDAAAIPEATADTASLMSSDLLFNVFAALRQLSRKD